MEKNRVEVVIDGQIITLVSEEDAAYMQKVALYIDKKLSEIRSSKSNKPVTEHLRTLLIAVNIADDYFKAVEKYQSLEIKHEASTRDLELMYEENTLLTEKLQEIRSQLSYVREQYVKEAGQLQEENARLSKKLKILQEQVPMQELEQQRQESARLADANRSLQKQLEQARSELEEYISNFDKNPDDLQNVVNFNSGTGGR